MGTIVKQSNCSGLDRLSGIGRGFMLFLGLLALSGFAQASVSVQDISFNSRPGIPEMNAPRSWYEPWAIIWMGNST